MKSYSFYLVSTPIGNLADLSSRAVEVLRSVDLVLAEDTRTARRLFERHGIETPTRSFHDHNKEKATPGIVERLRAGERMALVSEAGTPGVSDPGFFIVRALVEASISFTAIPGPNAAIDALVLSGLPTDRFTFRGYLPRKSGRLERVLSEARDDPGTTIFFESPHRLVSTLAVLDRVLGDRPVAVARELTKLHEEVTRGTAAEVLDRYRDTKVRGEVTLVIAGAGRRRRGTA